MPPKYTFAQRRRIHVRAKRKLGLLKRDAQDRYVFLEQCINELVDEGSDPDEARSVCELLYDEEDDLGLFD